MGCADAHHGGVEADQVGKMRGEAVEIMGGHQDRDATLVEFAEKVEHFVAGTDIDPRCWFVHQQQFRVAEQGAGDEHSLLLTTGELADVTVGEIADAEAFEDVGDSGPFCRVGPRPVAAVTRRHQHGLGNSHREVPVDRLDLGDIADAEVGSAGDGSVLGVDESEEESQHGCLAGPRRADDPGECAGPDCQRDIIEDRVALSVAARDLVESDQRIDRIERCVSESQVGSHCG